MGGEVLLGILLGKPPVITQNLGNANFASLLSSGMLQWRLRKPAEIRAGGFRNMSPWLPSPGAREAAKTAPACCKSAPQ